MTPDDSELDEIARDSNGKLKKLNAEQMQSIRNTGRFSVPSVHFQGSNPSPFIPLPLSHQSLKQPLTMPFIEDEYFAA